MHRYARIACTCIWWCVRWDRKLIDDIKYQQHRSKFTKLAGHGENRSTISSAVTYSRYSTTAGSASPIQVRVNAIFILKWSQPYQYNTAKHLLHVDDDNKLEHRLLQRGQRQLVKKCASFLNNHDNNYQLTMWHHRALKQNRQAVRHTTLLPISDAEYENLILKFVRSRLSIIMGNRLTPWEPSHLHSTRTTTPRTQNSHHMMRVAEILS